jgi:hypothetical protein
MLVYVYIKVWSCRQHNPVREEGMRGRKGENAIEPITPNHADEWWKTCAVDSTVPREKPDAVL